MSTVILPLELEQQLANVEDLGRFDSPFPSREGSSKISKMIEEVTRGGSEGFFAQQSANMQKRVMQGVLKDKALNLGDLRSDWLAELVDLPIPLPDGTVRTATGLFDQLAEFSAGTTPGSMIGSLAIQGVQLAQDFLGAIPFAGNVLNLAIGIGRFFSSLFRRKRQEIERRVPWTEYSRAGDEDIVRNVLKATFATPDWTRLFGPDQEIGNGFEFARAEEKDGYVWGSFREVGIAGLEPRWSNDVGFMPGSQRIISTVQGLVVPRRVSGNIVGIDQWSATDTGSFLPATAQTLTGVWQMCMRAGNPDMFKIQSQRLIEDWSNYFGAMFEDFASEYARLQGSGGRFRAALLGRMLGPVIVMRDGPGQPWRGSTSYRQSTNVGFYHPRMFEQGPYDRERYSVNCQRGSECWYARSKQYASIGEAVVLPALEQIKERQYHYLGHSLVAAYVCPESYGDYKSYAAFEDPGLDDDGRPRGQVLRERCRAMRDALLFHEDRFKIRLTDVRNVDPRFAEELERSGVTENSWKFADNPATQLHRYVPPGIGFQDPDEPDPTAVAAPEGGYPGEETPGNDGSGNGKSGTTNLEPGPKDFIRTILGATVLAVGVGGAVWAGKKYVFPALQRK